MYIVLLSCVAFCVSCVGRCWLSRAAGLGAWRGEGSIPSLITSPVENGASESYLLYFTFDVPFYRRRSPRTKQRNTKLLSPQPPSICQQRFLPPASHAYSSYIIANCMAQKSRPHAPLMPMRSAPAYFLCKWGV